MAQPSNEEIVRRYIAAHTAHDYDTVGILRDPEWTCVWPQSGERVRGHANDRAIMDNWPGGLPNAGEEFRVVGSEDRWVVTPLNTINRVVGSGDFWWADGTSSYPDGSTWFITALLQLRSGKMYRETWYFAPPFDAPAWRAAWVERMSGVGRTGSPSSTSQRIGAVTPKPSLPIPVTNVPRYVHRAQSWVHQQVMGPAG